MNKIQLGDRVEQIFNGFTGIAYGMAEYLTGCTQVLVMPENLDEKGEIRKSQWFDIDMLKVVKTKEELTQIKNTGNGGPDNYDAPTK
jgi:hypothetical protein